MYLNVKCLIILIWSVLLYFLNVAFSFDSCFEHAVTHDQLSKGHADAHPNEQTGNFKCCFTELQSITANADVWRMSDRPDQVEKVLPCVVLWVCVIAATQRRSFSVELSVEFPTLLPCSPGSGQSAHGGLRAWEATQANDKGDNSNEKQNCSLEVARQSESLFFVSSVHGWVQSTLGFVSGSVFFCFFCKLCQMNSVWNTIRVHSAWLRVLHTHLEGLVCFSSYQVFLLRLRGWEWLRSQSNSTPRFCFRRFL